jgi:hypothetical protein
VSWPKKSSTFAEVDQTIRVEGRRKMEMVNRIEVKSDNCHSYQRSE